MLLFHDDLFGEKVSRQAGLDGANKSFCKVGMGRISVSAWWPNSVHGPPHHHLGPGPTSGFVY